MKYVPADRQEDLKNLYRTLHGGVREFPDTETADDHGDVAEFATPVAVGQPVEGTLDYIFDFDYIRFQGEEGQKYRINVHHEALRPTSVVLYSPNGRTGENRSWIARDLVSTGPRIVWIAPTSDDYYFAVHNFGGKTGTYTIAITAVGAAPWDDHGDTRATATDIFPGEIIEGSVDDDVDIDYFRFAAVQGQDYLIKVESGTLDEFLVQAHLSTELTRRWNKTNMVGWVGDAFRWTSNESGDVYIGVHGAVEDVGDLPGTGLRGARLAEQGHDPGWRKVPFDGRGLRRRRPGIPGSCARRQPRCGLPRPWRSRRECRRRTGPGQCLRRSAPGSRTALPRWKRPNSRASSPSFDMAVDWFKPHWNPVRSRPASAAYCRTMSLLARMRRTVNR